VRTAGILLWVVLPYVALALFVAGHVWRYRFDQFGWTSRSTQLLESRWLAWGSNLFHYGALAAIAGHVLGMLIPDRLTAAGWCTPGACRSSTWAGPTSCIAAATRRAGGDGGRPTAHRRTAQAPAMAQGSMRSMPVPSKSGRLRVARMAPRDRQMAAMSASNPEIGLPDCSRALEMRA